MHAEYKLATNDAPSPKPAPPGHPVHRLRWLLATRPAFLSITLVGVLLGFSTAWHAGSDFDPLSALLALLFALTAHAGANVVNDFHDQAGDALNTERVFPFTGGSRCIQNGVLTPRQTRLLGYGLLASVVPAGIWLSAQAGSGLLLIGLIGLVVGWAYSAPPLRLASRGLGECAILAGWLVVVIGSDVVQRHHFAWLPLVAGLGYALLVVAVLYINQFPDAVADAQSGKRTLVVRLGRPAARFGYFALLLLAYGSMLVATLGTVLPASTFITLAALPFSLAAARGLWRFAEQPAQLVSAIKQTILAAHLYGLLLIATLIIDKVRS